MARQFPWLRILAEGVAIIVSILLAFGVQAWWEDNRERREEQQSLIGLEADFLANLIQLNRTETTHTDFMRATAHLLEMSDRERAALTRDSVAVLVRAMTTPATFAARDGTLDAMLASGRLDIIRDPVLRDLLVRWSASLDDVSEEVSRLYDATVQVRQRVLGLGAPWPFIEGLRDAPSEFRTAADEYGPTDLVIIANDERAMQLALGRAWMAGTYLNEVRPMAALAEDVLHILDAQIESAQPLSLVVRGSSDAPLRGWLSYQALASFRNGTTRSVGLHAGWSSSDSSVVALGSYGLGRAGEPGQSEVCATYRGMSNCIRVSVDR